MTKLRAAADILKKIRHKLDESDIGFDRDVNFDPPGRDLQHRQIVPGYDSPMDVFFRYLDRITDPIQKTYDVSDEKIFAVIEDYADHCTDEGQMPEFPSDSSLDGDILKWVNMAEYSDFESKVRRELRDAALKDNWPYLRVF